MPYVYRYIDLQKEEVVYIGKVTYDKNDQGTDGLVQRHYQHKTDDWYEEIGDENLLLQYIHFPSHTDADIMETYLINYYDTGQLRNKAKTGWGKPSYDLYTAAINGRWRNFRQGPISTRDEISNQISFLVESLMKSTEGLCFNIEGGLSDLNQRIIEMRNDMIKAKKISRYDAQDDFLRTKVG